MALKYRGTGTVGHGSSERTRRPWAVPTRSLSARAIMAELNFLYLWVGCMEKIENSVNW